MKSRERAEHETAGEDDPRDRPTIPVPPPVTVRIELVRVAYGFAREDLVLADLARDPRSEFCADRPSGRAVIKTSALLPPPHEADFDDHGVPTRAIA
jgi:hypothetical protein